MWWLIHIFSSYVGVFLKDLVITAESSSTIGEHDLINYHKYRLTAQIIRQFQKFQAPERSPYPFQRQEHLYDTIWDMPSIGPRELLDLSKTREPPPAPS